jgi:hypothetical protein
MPLSFLNDDQRNRYARLTSEATPEQLARYFLLDGRDRRIINSHRGDHSRLGFAARLCTARFLGAFLEDLADIPAGVLNHLARQLSIEQLSCFPYYRASETRWDHAAEIRQHCGLREFTDPVMQFRMNRWLYALCWTGTDRPGVLFVLLPVVTTWRGMLPSYAIVVEERICTLLTLMGTRLGICGEHGGEPSSVQFCYRVGMNYVSCSTYRVPIARLAAAQAAISGDKSQAMRTA